METHCTDETWPKRTDDNGFRSTSKLFTNCPRRGKDVIIRRRDKGEWRVKQRLAPELYECLNVAVS